MRFSKQAQTAVLALSTALMISIGCGGGGGGSTAAAPPASVAPAITTQPANQTVLEGSTATFSVVATGTAPLSYQWKKGGVALPGATSAIHTTPATTLADHGASYTVVVSNGVGNPATSAPAILAVQGLQAVPATPTGVAATSGDGRATLRWDASLGATSYNLYYGTSVGSVRATGTKVANAVSPKDLTGLTNGVTYYFAVTAVNANGESAASSEISTMPAATLPPAAPTGVTATAGNGQVTIGWTAVGNATSYNLYWGTATGVSKTSGTAILGVSSPYVHAGRTNGTTYFYVVTAVNAFGESAASLQVSATPSTGTSGGTKTQLIGSYPQTSSHYGSRVAVAGSQAYFCENHVSWTDTYVRILNIATPSAPVLSGSYLVGGLVSAIQVQNGYMYLGLDNILQEFQTIGVGNPAVPTLLVKNTNVSPLDIAISGSSLFTIGTYSGDPDYISKDFNSFSLTNPAAPARVGSFYQWDATRTNVFADSSRLALQGNYAYVAASSRGLVVLNVSNPAAPTYSGGYNSSVPNGYYAISASGNYACVMNSNYDIEILNISNPAAITAAGTYTPSALAGGFVLAGQYLYVAEGVNGLKIIDITNPSSPIVVGSYKPTGTDPNTTSLFVSGQDIYLADGKYGLLIVRFTP
jgi:fibronectin type 3 domain-containing protein